MAVRAHTEPTGLEPVEPLIGPGHTYGSVTDKISDIVLERPSPRAWYGSLFVGLVLLMVFLNSTAYLFYRGTGLWGINIPVAWGWAIVNFVWWIGIGHAGTLISAILFLLNQEWRNSINRAAEAMTLFAVACAGMFPLLHLGRPWVFYFIMPLPNMLAMWPNFLSPLVWDVFAISTYGTVSALFWFTGLIPDLATLRDRAKNKAARLIYGMLAMGWTGSAKHWLRYEVAYMLLAGISTPLVVSVHTIVSFDFAVGIVPGWHATIFPPYFVAGAIYCGFAMVIVLMLPVRYIYGLQDLITKRHMDLMAKVMLASGLIVAYGYLMELFFAYYSGNVYERFMMINRTTGPYMYAYWALILTNITIPQLLWFKHVRINAYWLFFIGIVINIGMWLERYVIVITSLTRDFLPSSWGTYHGTIWDWATYLGTLGLFLTLFVLFVRFLPMISIFEIRHLMYTNRHETKHS